MISSRTPDFAGLQVGFGRIAPDGSNMAINYNTAAAIGQAYWGDIPEGFGPINMTVHQKTAREKFIKAGITAVIPWSTDMDQYVQKAIFSDPHMERDECNEFAAKMNDEIQKAGLETAEYIQKAMSTTGGGGANMMHSIVDESVTYMYKAPYPMQALIPVTANKGKTAAWDAIGPYDFANAAFGTEDPNLTESDPTTYTRTDTVKYMYSVGRLTKAVKFAGLAQYPVRDLKAIRIDMAQDAMRALRERSLLGVNRNVSDTTNAFTDATSIQYAGLYEKITAASSYAHKTYEDVSASSVDTYGEIMTYLDKTYRNMVKMRQRPNLAICDYVTFGIIRRGLAEYFRYAGEPVKTLIPGLSKIDLVFPNHGGLALVPHELLPMSTGANGCIFLIDTAHLERRVLWQDTYEELANINTSDKFVISASETFIDRSDVDGSSSLQGGLIGITI